MFNEYIIGAIAAAFVATGGWGYYQKKQADLSAAEAAVLRSELTTCGARLSNILEDIASDAAIDNLPDDALTDVPAHWLRPNGATDN